MANPLMPSVFRFLSSGLIFTERILFSGRNVTTPSLLSFRYLMHCAAILSFSTTMLLIFAPAATSNARLYSDCTFPKVLTSPWTPSSFISSIFCTATPAATLSLMLIFLAFSFTNSSFLLNILVRAFSICSTSEEFSERAVLSSRVVFLKLSFLFFSFSS